MYLSCLNHVNELLNVATANTPIFMPFYIMLKYVSIINIEFAFLSCLHQLKELIDNPKLVFFVTRQNVSIPHPLIAFILHKIILSLRNHFY